ncbi:flagellar biosynthesis protein FlhA [Elioraea tepida]|jgi:flagellar biosynthesis protein FlhA|uniref:Flagellar biosynthesis protein FlhA n=1 Tax=Elioraea tepida TaxID=2843330 RepID=A0A975U395_9PROT|nr:flagellar biosynthesis protein FlhA [Elioraea tepida]QXM24291.1 flagellar biosynthesis protein FlhA [Elioraea tepida]
MAEGNAEATAPTLAARVSRAVPTPDVLMAIGVVLLIVILVVPLPHLLLDLGLALSITASVLVLMTAMFMRRPLDFTSFPTLLLITTLLRLGLNLASTRLILSAGHEGPQAAGAVIAAFGGFLMGGDVVIGLIVFAILVLVNFVVITKGSGRIAEVAARFSLDAMPGKQMAIDADLSAGLIDEAGARRRRKELEEESAFFGAMDGAAKFVKGDAVAGLVITLINLIGGLVIGVAREGMSFSAAIGTYSLLTIGDGLVSQIPALITSTAAGIVVTKAGVDGRTDEAVLREIAGSPKPLAMAAGAAGALALMPGIPMLPFLAIAGIAGAAAWARRDAARRAEETAAGAEAPALAAPPAEEPVTAALRIDAVRLELGYALLGLATAEGGARLTEQIRALRRALASEMGFLLPPVRIQDNVQLPPTTYVVRIKELEAGRAEVRPGMLLAMDPTGAPVALPGEKTTEPAFGIPAAWIDATLADEAAARGYTVVDPASVITTHLTELVRDQMAELLSFAETQKLLDELPREHQKLVAELIPQQISTAGVQRVLQALLAERVSIRDLPTILEGIAEALAAGARGVAGIVAQVRVRLARQISEQHTGPNGYIPLVTLSPEWERAFAESMTGPPEDRQLAMAPSRLTEFMTKLREAIDRAANAGEAAVLLVSPALRPHVRAVVERFRAATPVLSQAEIHPRARIRTVGTV